MSIPAVGTAGNVPLKCRTGEFELTSRSSPILFYIFVDKEPFAAAGVNSNSCHCSGNISFEMQKSSGPGENLQPFLLLAVTVAFYLLPLSGLTKLRGGTQIK